MIWTSFEPVLIRDDRQGNRTEGFVLHSSLKEFSAASRSFFWVDCVARRVAASEDSILNFFTKISLKKKEDESRYKEI